MPSSNPHYLHTLSQRDDLVRLAFEYDIPVKTIAKALGITSQAVYLILRKGEKVAS